MLHVENSRLSIFDVPALAGYVRRRPEVKAGMLAVKSMPLCIERKRSNVPVDRALTTDTPRTIS